MTSKEPLTILRVISNETYERLLANGLLFPAEEKKVDEQEETQVDEVTKVAEFPKSEKHSCTKPSGWTTFEEKFKTFT